MPVSATIPFCSSHAVHSGPRASRISTAFAWAPGDSARPAATP